MENAESPAPGPFVLSTDTLDPSGRFETWRGLVSDFNDVLVSDSDQGSFHAYSGNWNLGGMLFSVNRATRLRLIRTRFQAAQSDLDHRVLFTPIRGRSVTVAGDMSYLAGPSDLVVGSLRDFYDYRLMDADGGEWIEICIARDRFPALWSSLGLLERGIVRQPGSVLLVEFLRALAHTLSCAQTLDLAALGQVTRSLIAATIARDAAARPPSRRDMFTLNRALVEKTVSNELASARLDPERIADITGLSRMSIYRLFEEEGGVASYVQRRRLEAVHADLLDIEHSTASIASIAEKRGFHCVSTFNRAFRRHYASTPSEFRASRMQRIENHSKTAEAHKTFGDLSDLYRKIR